MRKFLFLFKQNHIGSFTYFLIFSRVFKFFLLSLVLSLNLFLALAQTNNESPESKGTENKNRKSDKAYIFNEIRRGSSKNIPPLIEGYIETILLPLIEDKASFASYELQSIEKNNEQSWDLKISTFGYVSPIPENTRFDINDPQLARFEYVIHFGSFPHFPTSETNLIVSLKTKLVPISPRKNQTHFFGELFLNTDQLEKYLKEKINSSDKNKNQKITGEILTAQLRSLFRADPYLHPMSDLYLQRPLFRALARVRREVIEPQNQLSADQKEAIRQLLEIEQRQPEEQDHSHQAKISGLIMSTGMGKTNTVAAFINELKRRGRLADHVKLVVVYQNVAALSQLQRFFKKQWGLSDGEILSYYGDHERIDLEKKPQFRVLLATRSSYFSNRKSIHLYVQSHPEMNWFYLFDEAHHLGALDGEFQQIFFGSGSSSAAGEKSDRYPSLMEALSSKDRILMTTATPWHLDTNIIKKYMQGNVAAPGLSEQERGELASTNNIGKIQEIISLQLFRNMALGNLSVPEKIITYSEQYPEMEKTNPKDNPSWLKTLNDSVRKVVKVNDFNQQTDILRREILIYEIVVNKILDILYSEQQVGVKNQGLIIAPTIAHAEFYKSLLRRKLSEDRNKRKRFWKRNVLISSYHSGLKSEQREQAENDFIYRPQPDADQFLVVVNAFREAIDVRGINLVINTAQIDSYQSLVQIFGRPARIATGKTGFRFIDLTESILSLLRYSFPSAFPVDTKLVTQKWKKNEVILESPTLKLGEERALIVPGDKRNELNLQSADYATELTSKAVSAVTGPDDKRVIQDRSQERNENEKDKGEQPEQPAAQANPLGKIQPLESFIHPQMLEFISDKLAENKNKKTLQLSGAQELHRKIVDLEKDLLKELIFTDRADISEIKTKKVRFILWRLFSRKKYPSRKDFQYKFSSPFYAFDDEASSFILGRLNSPLSSPAEQEVWMTIILDTMLVGQPLLEHFRDLILTSQPKFFFSSIFGTENMQITRLISDAQIEKKRSLGISFLQFFLGGTSEGRKVWQELWLRFLNEDSEDGRRNDPRIQLMIYSRFITADKDIPESKQKILIDLFRSDWKQLQSSLLRTSLPGRARGFLGMYLEFIKQKISGASDMDIFPLAPRDYSFLLAQIYRRFKNTPDELKEFIYPSIPYALDISTYRYQEWPASHKFYLSPFIHEMLKMSVKSQPTLAHKITTFYDWVLKTKFFMHLDKKRFYPLFLQELFALFEDSRKELAAKEKGEESLAQDLSYFKTQLKAKFRELLPLLEWGSQEKIVISSGTKTFVEYIVQEGLDVALEEKTLNWYKSQQRPKSPEEESPTAVSPCAEKLKNFNNPI